VIVEVKIVSNKADDLRRRHKDDVHDDDDDEDGRDADVLGDVDGVDPEARPDDVGLPQDAYETGIADDEGQHGHEETDDEVEPRIDGSQALVFIQLTGRLKHLQKNSLNKLLLYFIYYDKVLFDKLFVYSINYELDEGRQKLTQDFF